MKNFAEKIKRSLTLCLYVIALFPLFHNSNYSLSQAATASWSLTSNGNPAVTGNITATAVSKGSGRPDYGGIGAMSHTTDGVRSQNWNRSSYLSFSITSQYYNRDYYEYTVTPTPGNDFNITSVTLEASASTSTPSWFVYYSLDGFATYTQLGVRNSTSLTGLNITVPSGSTLTLRIFGMDLVSNTTYFRNKNVAISGTTSLGCSTPAQPSAITGSGTICATANGTYSVTNDPTATSYTWTLPSGWSGSSTTNSINATSGANGGTITVTATNACGTSAQQTFNVTTTTVPTQPSAITGNGTICATANGTYSVTNDPTATSYTWTLPSGWSGSSTTNSISATSGANGGTITVTANNACGASVQQVLTITTTTIDNTVSLSGATLTANQAGATYQWINCTAGNTPVSGATNQSFTPASNGTYAVQITHNGCSDVSSCIVVSSVGIEAAEVNTFHVYPNPGTGIYTLSTQYSFEPSQVTIYTASGQLVNAFSISSQGQQLIVDISNQPEGIYMIFVHTPVTNFHVKICKQ
ncbi:MAG: T9SS type A sorting domain-containing protein [Crocinitomicaceae bacterium]|nr:T9SS type A sorting domain-containing protein [Crocinitomicaceae bacterium]